MSSRTRRLCRLIVLALAALAAMRCRRSQAPRPSRSASSEGTLSRWPRPRSRSAKAAETRPAGTAKECRRGVPTTAPIRRSRSAVRGEWDRELFASTILGERHVFSSGEEYWIPYDRNVTSELWHYGEYGLCELRMPNGSTLLMQAGRSGPSPTFIPEAVPLELRACHAGRRQHKRRGQAHGACEQVEADRHHRQRRRQRALGHPAKHVEQRGRLHDRRHRNEAENRRERQRDAHIRQSRQIQAPGEHARLRTRLEPLAVHRHLRGRRQKNLLTRQ